MNLDRQGVYVLRGPSGNGAKQRIYVGRAGTGTLSARLGEHKTSDKTKFWRETVAITSDENVTPVPVVYLEARLIALAKQAGLADVNQNAERPPPMSPMQEASARSFLRDTLHCIRALGFSEFGSGADEAVAGGTSDQDTAQSPPDPRSQATKVLTVKGRDITAYARANDDGTVVILPQSLMAVDDSDDVLDDARDARQDAVSAEKVKLLGDGGHYVVTESICVRNETLAKQVILGNQGRGRPNWEDVPRGDDR